MSTGSEAKTTAGSLFVEGTTDARSERGSTMVTAPLDSPRAAAGPRAGRGATPGGTQSPVSQPRSFLHGSGGAMLMDEGGGGARRRERSGRGSDALTLGGVSAAHPLGFVSGVDGAVASDWYVPGDCCCSRATTDLYTLAAPVRPTYNIPISPSHASYDRCHGYSDNLPASLPP
jgi:hypothetical protein